MDVKALIYAAIFSAGVGSASFVLIPRIDAWKFKYEKEVITSKGLKDSLNEQNTKVHELGEESNRMIENSKIAIEQAKKDNVMREHKIESLMSSKAPTLDLCNDVRELIDKEIMQ